ncbi:ankyrin repeat domain-containing protein [Meiothermus sp.]|uniref:ankyrin repeat domain-containing protein n=1 Tax=Meiothermus sp. TaxID=1955249 RepID=UPI00307EBEA0
MRRPKAPWYALALLGLALCGLWSISATNQVRADFDQDARILHRILSQKTEQHEAVLSSLVALDKTGVSGATLSSFAEAVILGDGGSRHTEIVRLLLAAGANPNLADRDGVTPLQHARRRGYSSMIRLLEQAGGR